MVEEAHKSSNDELEGGVDFVRCKCMYHVMTDIIRFQPVPFNFHHVHQISSFLRTFKTKEMSDEELFLLSFTAEPKTFNFV